jgi:ferredoxin
MAIKKLWIEEGCISCSLCMDICPQVFDVKDGEDCVITPNALEHFDPQYDDIVLAAEDCPVEVIQYDA